MRVVVFLHTDFLCFELFVLPINASILPTLKTNEPNINHVACAATPEKGKNRIRDSGAGGVL